MKTVIRPDISWALEWREFFKNKELLYFFTWRNFKVRYKQTALGAAWAIFKPLILMVVFTFAFNRVGNIEGGEGIPYPVFSYAGLLFWTYFSQTVNQVGTSVVSAQGIISKIYFPRLIVPVSTALTGIIDLLLASAIYVVILIVYSQPVEILGVMLYLPFVLLSFLAVLGVGLFMAALNVKYRDITQALPFFIQALLFLTPVIYPVSAVPQSLQWILFLNPIAGPIDAFRAALLGHEPIAWGYLAISIASCFVLLFVGLRYFKAKEREFADYI